MSTLRSQLEPDLLASHADSHSMVHSLAVVEEAIKAARRVNDYSTAVRIFEGLSASIRAPRSSGRVLTALSPSYRSFPPSRLVSDDPFNPLVTSSTVPPRAEEKTENASQYQQYVQETAPLRKDLGILLKEELY